MLYFVITLGGELAVP